jgi:hypothetical protein
MYAKDLTAALLSPYLTGVKKHKAYAQSVKMYKELEVHADGAYPRKLIDERRPNEAPHIKEYRQSIYEPVTQDVINRVASSLTKIRRSVDWSITHPIEYYAPSIPEQERLHRYADTSLPLFESLEGWLFTVGLKNYLLDANAIVLITPVSTELADAASYLEPVPVIYNSPAILEYIPNSLLIVLVNDGANGEPKEFRVVTRDESQKWVASGDGITMIGTYAHKLGYLPAFRLGGTYYSTVGTSLIYASRIAPMLPRLNDAAREYSDLQAEVVQHIHSEKWEWAADRCPSCRNAAGVPTGFVNGTATGAKKITCPSCKGNLLVPSSPYLSMQIRPTNAQQGEANAPIPPAGYITKDVAIVKIQDERIDKHLYKALASINMHFLDQSPLSQSGIAKEVDRDELNNFVYAVAEDLVRIMQLAYNCIIDYRYSKAMPNNEDRVLIRPRIAVPEKLDLLSTTYLAAEIKQVKDAGINPLIVSTLEAEFAAKKFYNEPKVRDLIHLVLSLDPLAGISEEDKMVRLNNGGVSRLAYVLSSNILSIVKEAMQVKGFDTSSPDAQRAAVETIAEALGKRIDGARITVV